MSNNLYFLHISLILFIWAIFSFRHFSKYLSKHFILQMHIDVSNSWNAVETPVLQQNKQLKLVDERMKNSSHSAYHICTLSGVRAGKLFADFSRVWSLTGKSVLTSAKRTNQGQKTRRAGLVETRRLVCSISQRRLWYPWILPEIEPSAGSIFSVLISKSPFSEDARRRSSSQCACAFCVQPRERISGKSFGAGCTEKSRYSQLCVFRICIRRSARIDVTVTQW